MTETKPAHWMDMINPGHEITAEVVQHDDGSFSGIIEKMWDVGDGWASQPVWQSDRSHVREIVDADLIAELTSALTRAIQAFD
jgi:hypothetical protein